MKQSTTYTSQAKNTVRGTQLLKLMGICTLMLICGSAMAQWRAPLLTEVKATEGLPMWVSAIADDFIGYKYFGGNMGLVRYDGQEFELMSHDPNDTTTIGPGEIYNVIAGSDSLLWIGLRFGGLNSYDPVTRQFSRYPVPQLAYTTTPTVRGLYDDGAGNLWAGGHHFQLLRFDKELKIYESFQPEWVDPQKHGGRLSIERIIPDKNNDDLLWLAVLDYAPPNRRGGHSIVSFRKSTGEFVQTTGYGKLANQDSLGRLYGVYRLNYITRYDPRDSTTVEIPVVDPDIEYITRGVYISKDATYVTNRSSMYSLDSNDRATLVLKLDDPINDRISEMTEDNDGNLWFENTEGVYVLEKARQHIRYFSIRQFGDIVRIFPAQLAYDPHAGCVYMVSRRNKSVRRIYRIPMEQDQPASFYEYDNTIDAIAQNGRTTYVTSNRAMHVLQQDGTLTPYRRDGFDNYSPPTTWNLRRSADGFFGGAGGNSFFWFKPGTRDVQSLTTGNDFEKPTSGESYITGFKFSRDGKSAYVHNSQIYKVSLNSGEVEHLKYPASFNPNGVTIPDVLEDNEGHLWINGPVGIARFRQDADSLVMVQTLLASDGVLSSGEARQLHLDRMNRMWIFNAGGMNCYDFATGEIRKFGTQEGLQSNFIDPKQVIENERGELITVNSDGVIIFDPVALWNSVSPSSVRTVIKDVRLNGEPVEFEQDPNVVDGVFIPPFRGVLDIAFQGLEFPFANNLSYSYRLSDGADWIDIGSNTLVTLPTLEPGKYNFQVKASVANGTAPVRTLNIEVGTPFYREWWFFLLVILAALFTIWIVYTNRVKSIRKAEKAKAEYNQRIAELELKALRSQMNPHFMFNSLNSIKNYILQAEPQIAAEYLSNFSHLIRLILQNSAAKTISLRDELETLLLYIDLEKLRFDDEFEFNCVVDEGIDMGGVMIPPMILQPYIENAIWHGLMHRETPGQLTLEFRKEAQYVTCIIEDNGVGRVAAAKLKERSIRKYKSMGMGITRDRIDIINKMDSMGISSDIVDLYDDGRPTGTRVVVRIPSDTSEENF